MIAQVVPVILAFGANLGDRAATIYAAQREIAQTAGVSGFVSSPLRESIAVTVHGPDAHAPRYLNGVAQAKTTLTPHELLDVLQAAEQRHGRVRSEHWGDRTLDVDLVLFGGRAIHDERLTVPHPRAHERDFVLSPWLALDPHAVLMGHGRVRDLLEGLGDTTAPYVPAMVSGVVEGETAPAILSHSAATAVEYPEHTEPPARGGGHG